MIAVDWNECNGRSPLCLILASLPHEQPDVTFDAGRVTRHKAGESDVLVQIMRVGSFQVGAGASVGNVSVVVPTGGMSVVQHKSIRDGWSWEISHPQRAQWSLTTSHVRRASKREGVGIRMIQSTFGNPAVPQRGS
jgi:hypothetical protein